MKKIKFWKEKAIYFLLLFMVMMTVEIFLIPFNVHIAIRVYIFLMPIFTLFICTMIEYKRKSIYYEMILNNMQELEQKYLISEMIHKPTFAEAQVLKDILTEAGKSMLENVNQYKYLQQDYKEYIELWIHEIKTPIAASKLVIENHKNEATQSIAEELEKIENYTEQALYYARSSTVEKDYCIKKTILKDIVNATVLKNKNLCISEKINLKLENLEKEVYTDSKWTIFILNQILQNSIKYMKKENEKQIHIFATEKKNKVILEIQDNGIGIPKGEITRVFEKGFTGTNGRILEKKATGLGLYLCQKLCHKLGLEIELNSELEKGTSVRLIFPKNSLTVFENGKD